MDDCLVFITYTVYTGRYYKIHLAHTKIIIISLTKQIKNNFTAYYCVNIISCIIIKYTHIYDATARYIGNNYTYYYVMESFNYRLIIMKFH